MPDQSGYNEDGTFEVEMCGWHISGQMKDIPTVAEPAFDNLFGSVTINTDGNSITPNVPIGTAKQLALKYALERLEIGGNVRKLNRDNVAASIPILRDPETGESLFERLVQYAVKRNRWLTKRGYARIFDAYLADEEIIEAEEDDDPLELPELPKKDSGKPAKNGERGSDATASG